MQLINVKEIPGNWLVLDHYVQSGIVEFVSHKRNLCPSCEELMEENYRFKYCCNCGDWLVYEFFGDKHIQLITANPRPSTIYGIIAGSKDGVLGNIDIWERAKLFIKSGKDFFIYKVTEVKNG